jgi:CIC family chloride channel protein
VVPDNPGGDRNVTVSGASHTAGNDGGPVAPVGFDVRPDRPVWLTIGLFVVVVFAAAGFAHLFRDTAKDVLDWYGDSTDPTKVATSLQWFVVFAVATLAVIVAAGLGWWVDERWKRHVGVEAVAASARDEGRTISLRATAVRAAATWTVSAGLVSVGRESAIIETGGAMGATVARRFRGRGDAMAAVGIAAAFSAAYHAPIAAILYVEEHLGVRSSRRALKFVVLGALAAHLVSITLMSGHEIFPPIQGSRWEMLRMGLIALVPAALMARGFLQLRVRVSGGALARRLGCPHWVAVMGLATVAGAAVATFPLAAGNGMEALRHGSLTATWTLAVALLVGKSLGTAASLGAGAPGGVLTPTMSIATGAALLVLLGLHAAGMALDHPWDAMIVAMAVGVAVGMRSPLGAIFLLPEMVGDYTLVPVVAVVVGLAVVIDRGLDELARYRNHTLPTGVYDEDA